MQFEPKIDKDSAVKALAKKENFMASVKNICSTELLYLPYYLFNCTLHFNKEKVVETLVGVDQVIGECAHIRSNSGTKPGSGAIIKKALIPVDKAKEIAERFVLSETLYKKNRFSGLNYTNVTFKYLFVYPYWIGYYRTGKGIDFNIIDAVTGQKQGPRMKAVFIKYLMQ